MTQSCINFGLSLTYKNTLTGELIRHRRNATECPCKNTPGDTLSYNNFSKLF
jgi:hypothetical protein